MRKLLQILAVVILILGAAALYLGSVLFGQRELLKGRTQALEKGIVAVANQLEAPQDEGETAKDLVEKDVADVTAQLVPEPEREAFWSTYPIYLENPDQPLFKLNREDLKNYYKIDLATQKPAKDATTGQKITTGAGTMDEWLQKVSEAATYEQTRLNATRHQLKALREKLVATITELNDGKQKQRQSLVTIQDQRNTIAGLENDKSQLTAQVADLESEKQALNDEIAQKNKDIETKDEDIAGLKETVASQAEQIRKLKVPTTGGGMAAPTQLSGIIKMEAGQKGKVVSVNQDWSYVVLQLDDKALAEIDTMRAALVANNTPGFPAVELFLKRGDQYVSKIKIVQLKPDQKLAVADVLSDWQHAAVQAGDVAFF